MVDQSAPPVDTKAGDKFVTSEQIGPDTAAVFHWSMQQLNAEVLRLQKQQVNPIEIQVIDMSVLVQGQKLQLNRVVFNTELDFNLVERIMISPSVPIPCKPGFQYVNVLLFGKGKPQHTPIIFPYVFKTRLREGKQGKNSLKHWVFVNSKCEESY